METQITLQIDLREPFADGLSFASQLPQRGRHAVLRATVSF